MPSLIKLTSQNGLLSYSMAKLAAFIGVMLLATGMAQASSVSLVPEATTFASGAQFSVALNLDAADEGGASPGAYSGFVTVDYDSALVQFDGFVFLPPAASLMDATVTAGIPETIDLGFFGAPNVSSIGVFTFTALAPAGGTINFGLADMDDFFGTFANELPANLPIFPDFNGASVNVVPLPASAWLFMSALGFGFASARRRKAA